ncbi:hypothetical protein VHEMI10660 [[Torrubiella] hemipterigena]|uniref:Uncharacterized protein n=1 Tax=[Torrubiella] hemipterigena TaxID=1531966 RepID=A0A0A1TSM8_9HYPO|nr:hypothetical protein VHEMI10660 [[Torrubiella] hemipterigena]
MKYLNLLLLLQPVLAAHCPPTGPLLPPPSLASLPDSAGLHDRLNALLTSKTSSWNTSTNSFSVAITSLNDTIFEHHYTAPVRGEGGVAKVDSDTTYRIMSITKVFNALTLLLHAPYSLDTPVTKYIPELQGSKDYADVTLRMLTDQSAGMPRDGYAFDLYNAQGQQLIEAGFPIPDNKSIPSCDAVGMKTCSRATFFENLLQNRLSWLPGDKAGYSDQAFTLLGMAMENITGKPFAQLLRDSITTPLDMPTTGFNAPIRSRGIIPTGPGGVFWDFDIGNFNATAGLYSTPNELLKFVRAILNHILLSPANTREWMRPSRFAGSYTMGVGAPWEIFRLSHLTPDNRPVDIYTKSGSLPGYASYLVLIPEFNIGGAINVSGDDGDDAAFDLLDAVTSIAVPALDSLARVQAKETYAGKYTGQCDGLNCTASDTSSLELVVDSGPGLHVVSWVNNGKSVLNILAANKGAKTMDIEARLYPVGDGDRWRLAVERKHHVGGDTIRRPSEACSMWFQIDKMRYASLPVDEFVFRLSEGNAISVTNPGLRAKLTKEQGHGGR